MRKLTIIRANSFVGCLGTMKVYIEDAEAGDTEICNVRCRKLGDLKNGASAEFEIGEGEARIYVIADKLSANYCNDFYQLDAGGADITLTGRNRLNPAVGNAFRFDVNDNPEATKNRKMGLGKGALVFICAILIGGIIGYLGVNALFEIIWMQDKEFVSEDMSITLTKGFNEQYATGYESVFVSKNVDVLVFKNSFEKFGKDNLTAAEYAKAVMDNAKVDSEIITEAGLCYFSYDKELKNGEEYTYFVYAYRSDDAYWHIYFVVGKSNADNYSDDIEKWAGSVVFN